MSILQDSASGDPGMPQSSFLQFKAFLLEQLHLQPNEQGRLSSIIPSEIYSASSGLGINDSQMAKYMAEFLHLPYLPFIDPEEVDLGILPEPFCKSNSVAAINEDGNRRGFALSNPFDWQLLDMLKKFKGQEQVLKLVVTEPANIVSLFADGAAGNRKTLVNQISPAGDRGNIAGTVKEMGTRLSEAEIERHEVVHAADKIITRAVSERASDIHLEPKGEEMAVRFRVDGDMRDIRLLKKEMGIQIISRYKVLGGMDVAERRKPQDGTYEASIGHRALKLRLATTSTPDGESLIIRVLEPEAKSKDLQELGMTDEQVEVMKRFGNQTQGFILIVGPTGSGKTTTIYSLLSYIDCRTRSLVSVEDPVEYRITFANQQQVNLKAGITFESLLRSAMRQDPDILFLGEVRDSHSAKTALDFASTGHLTITTLHSANATTAVFRLERLEVAREIMADTVLGVVAQRLLKKLCPHCKEVVPISQEEVAMIAPFTSEVPSQVAHPVGCPQCNQIGYHGREGVYEIIRFDPEISKMIRSGRPIVEIRGFIRERGDMLISHHAVEKVKKLLFSPKDIYERVLVEEVHLRQDTPSGRPPKTPPPKTISPKTPPVEEPDNHNASILVVEDDKVTRTLIQRLLENSGYEVTVAEDGIDALLQLGKRGFDLIVSDVDMPNLDGFRLRETMNQKGIETPVIFSTGQISEEEEIKGFELGAADYIKKPIRKEILLVRVKSVLNRLLKKEAECG